MVDKVFVYGTLRKGQGNHDLLSDAEVVEQQDVIYGHSLVMACSAYPAVVENTDADAFVIGEVYKVSEEEMTQLDYLEGYPHHYNRKKVITHKGHEVWVYFYEHYNGERYIESGDWLCHY